jgi:hypothetical protein
MSDDVDDAERPTDRARVETCKSHASGRPETARTPAISGGGTAEASQSRAQRLLSYGFKAYSQHEEDGTIQEIFRRIGTGNRSFIEFGVETGVECNTVNLLLHGWSGLWLEDSAKYVKAIRKNLRGYIDAGKLAVAEALVTAENINTLISKNGPAGEIDLLSIDIDGNDYWVWKAITAVKPRVVIIEYNATLRPPLSVTVPYDPGRQYNGTNYFGASLTALTSLAQTKGYRLVGCNFSGSNAFFVRNELGQDAFHEPATAENHYEPPRYFFAALQGGHRPCPGIFETV